MLLTGLLLMAVGLLGSVLAWHYGSLLAFRLLTGVGAALVPPNSVAVLADVFPPTGRGKAIGWLLSASGVGAAVGVPLIALLLGWGVAAALCRDGHDVAGRVERLVALVPAPSAAPPIPGVLLPLPGGWRTRDVLVCVDREP